MSAHSTATATVAARCSLPARFSFTSTSTTIATTTAAAVTVRPVPSADVHREAGDRGRRAGVHDLRVRGRRAQGVAGARAK
ncbi:hypothetical protein [Streptomyces sp. NPDC047706]|uniref:hypothetical protein n=1 Tax=Streptomyces sp. NPDC047706 TaxID=3365486 RepID=UPI00372333B8